MTPLFKFLPQTKGSEAIRECWGEMPTFDGPDDLLHLAYVPMAEGVGEVTLTAVLTTTESDDLSACKPSRVCVRFSGVTHFEADNGRPDLNGIRLAKVFANPPDGICVVDFCWFHIAFRSAEILSCVRYSLTEPDDTPA